VCPGRSRSFHRTRRYRTACPRSLGCSCWCRGPPRRSYRWCTSRRYRRTRRGHTVCPRRRGDTMGTGRQRRTCRSSCRTIRRSVRRNPACAAGHLSDIVHQRCGSPKGRSHRSRRSCQGRRPPHSLGCRTAWCRRPPRSNWLQMQCWSAQTRPLHEGQTADQTRRRAGAGWRDRPPRARAAQTAPPAMLQAVPERSLARRARVPRLGSRTGRSAWPHASTGRQGEGLRIRATTTAHRTIVRCIDRAKGRHVGPWPGGTPQHGSSGK
jgi:hypothetical protein